MITLKEKAAKERRFLEFLKEQRQQINREVDQQEIKVFKLEARAKEKELENG